ncbi:MAG: FAD-binding oxidoreductase [Candidatus Kaiserbacteria bacterium]|nr:FAD-binding oxidoreductase [Candidatus Kaiserbacteria bacterium]MCB9816661.1 FAD-binding oxidoreductase [Candidatus Nomurabacteria bacterium]
MHIENAIQEWTQLLGSEAVLTDAPAMSMYRCSTVSEEREVPAVLVPNTCEVISELVVIARRHGVSLYPVSTGNNWGYSDSLPDTDYTVIVDLSKLQNISFDADLGVVTVEPGVTQQQLSEYLEAQQAPYLVPVSGAGPHCSLIGNALERGYGITPYADHWGALTYLKAVLPDGTLYQNALADMGAHQVAKLHKWGLGPYLDGIFSQGAFGIVTEATFLLKRKPEKTIEFLFNVTDDTFESAVAAVQNMLAELEGVVSGVNFMNGRRVLSMIDERLGSTLGPVVVPDEEVAAMLRSKQLTEWSGVGALYGSAEMVRAAKKIVKKHLKPHAKRLVFVTPGMLRLAAAGLAVLPNVQLVREFRNLVASTRLSMQMFQGQPSQVAMPLAYLKNTYKPTRFDLPLDPAEDGSGLAWFTPLLPIKPAAARAYVEIVDRVCKKHGIEPLITLTTISTVLFDSSVPLLYSKDDPDGLQRVRDCYAELASECLKNGSYVYRLGVHSMRAVADSDDHFWDIVAAIQQALDPQQTISPGRYAPLQQSDV